jgi:hypothetical protein
VAALRALAVTAACCAWALCASARAGARAGFAQQQLLLPLLLLAVVNVLLLLSECLLQAQQELQEARLQLQQVVLNAHTTSAGSAADTGGGCVRLAPKHLLSVLHVALVARRQGVERTAAKQATAQALQLAVGRTLLGMASCGAASVGKVRTTQPLQALLQVLEVLVVGCNRRLQLCLHAFKVLLPPAVLHRGSLCRGMPVICPLAGVEVSSCLLQLLPQLVGRCPHCGELRLSSMQRLLLVSCARL